MDDLCLEVLLFARGVASFVLGSCDLIEFYAAFVEGSPAQFEQRFDCRRAS
jgi:hypothetical protein